MVLNSVPNQERQITCLRKYIIALPPFHDRHDSVEHFCTSLSANDGVVGGKGLSAGWKGAKITPYWAERGVKWVGFRR